MSQPEQDLYLDSMRKSGVYGDGIALSAAVRLYRRSAVVFSPEAVQRIDLPKPDEDVHVASGAEVAAPVMYFGLLLEHYVSVKFNAVIPTATNQDTPHRLEFSDKCKPVSTI